MNCLDTSVVQILKPYNLISLNKCMIQMYGQMDHDIKKM